MRKMQPIEINYVDWGSGYKLGRTICLNKRLQDNPSVHDKILEHEVKHVLGLKFVDWHEPWDWEIFAWKLFHPSSWIELLPIWWHGGRRFSFDLSRMYFWIGIGLGFLSLYLIGRFFKWPSIH